MSASKNQICNRCIYDSSIPYISFDEEGVCNYCRQTEALDKDYPAGKAGEQELYKIAEEIKRAGKGKKYDVVIGVSGGFDSSYMCYLAKEVLGLRVLASHFDNTWNSKIAVENIQNLVERLDIDLHTHVMDNEEYCDLMRSFVLASVPDIDAPTDLSIGSVHYMAAKKYGVKYIFHGHNFRTEGISPQGWFYMDARYIKNIHDQFGSVPMRTLPNFWISKWMKWVIWDGIKQVRPLYWLKYDKTQKIDELSELLGWQWYGGHHMENRTAYFTNNYWLPKKFGYDLRYCEYSACIRNGTMTRKEAQEAIKEPKPFDDSILDEVKKRLRFSDKEWDAIMEAPNKSYRDYPTYKKMFERWRWFYWILMRLGMIPQSFYLKFTKKYDD